MKRVIRLSLTMLLCASTVAFAPWCAADDSWITKGDIEVNKGNYDDAITYYKRAQADESLNAQRACDRLWQLYAKLHRYQEAQQVLTELISKNNSPTYKFYLAEIYRKSGNFYAAQRAYEELISSDPEDESAIIGLGECLEATGNYDAARDTYSKLAEMNGSLSSTARTKLARLKDASSITAIDVEAEVGRWPASRMPLKVYIAEPANTPGYRSHMRDFPLQAVAEWSKASSGLVKMEVVNTNPEAADIVVTWVQQIPGAIGLMRPQLTEDGEIKKAVIFLACNSDQSGKALPAESPATRALYEARDRMLREVALHEMGHALGLDHSARTDDIMANGVFGLNSSDVLSARQLQQGDVERLVQLYSAPAQVKSKDAVASVSGGVGGATAKSMIVKSRDSASEGGEQFNSSAINDPIARSIQQALFSLSGGKYDEAITTLTEILKQSPNNAQAHYVMAVACVHKRDYLKAQNHYNAVLKLVPQGRLAELAHAGLSKIGK